ncbi:MAG: cytochrome P450 [Alphaproteobacteria bacterium]|nr:cytochrome P450 [Alphaproteobacteria bacterium]
MTVWQPQDDGHADLSDHDSFVNGAPYNTFARLRRDEPVAWCDYAAGRGFWSITRQADIMALNRDTELMSSAQGIRIEDQTYEEYLARRTFQETDPPDHTRVRRLLSKAFSGPVVQQFDKQIRDLCGMILNRALASREFDAVSDIARELPMRMLGQILGLPEKDLDWLVQRGDQLMANSDPDFTVHVVDKVDTDAYRLMPFRSPAGLELYDYAEQLMTSRARSGENLGVLGLLMQPDEQGNIMSTREFQNFFCLAVAAGNDTTRYSIAAAIHALTQQPEILAQLQSGKGNVWDTASDEFVRWASPATYFRRTATRDFDLHGKTIKQGDKVLYWFVSGNRDEEAFADPYRVNVFRSPNRHLGFGQGGPHVCLGMWLARLEIRVLMQELVKRVKTIELTDKIAFVRSNFVGGIKRLPVRLTLQ